MIQKLFYKLLEVDSVLSSILFKRIETWVCISVFIHVEYDISSIVNETNNAPSWVVAATVSITPSFCAKESCTRECGKMKSLLSQGREHRHAT